MKVRALLELDDNKLPDDIDLTVKEKLDWLIYISEGIRICKCEEVFNEEVQE